jgi:hypothetical protein
MRPPTWTDNALKQLSVLAHHRELLTSDDLHDRTGEPPHHNMMGDAIRRGVELGVLVPTRLAVQSRRPSAKGRRIQLYRSGFLPPQHHGDLEAAYLALQDTQEALFA